MVIEARKLSDKLKKEDIKKKEEGELDKILQSLDAVGYDEAEQYVYGMSYRD